MRETKKLYIGLATIMIAILLGSALLVPTAAYATNSNNNQNNGKDNHENDAKHKDRKGKDDHKDKGKNNECDDGKKKKTGQDDRYCKIVDLKKDIKNVKKDQSDANTLFLQNTLSSVRKFMQWNS
jgi:TATA-binding protein-associated factor Taf7